MLSISAVLKNALSKYAHLLGDVGAEVALPGKPKQGWRSHSMIFCDNIIVWCMANNAATKKENQVGDYVVDITKAFRCLGIKQKDVKFLGKGQLWDADIFSEKIQKKHLKRCAAEFYVAGYISIKITLRELPYVDVLAELPSIMSILAKKLVVLHDIDLAMDCQYVTSRAILEKYLKQVIPDVEFRDDRRKVGDHCLSWYANTDKDQRLRCKMYNKFVQLLESAEVRTSLGSRLEELVDSSNKGFRERLLEASTSGYSRLEITFYGAAIHKRKYYKNIMHETKDLLQGCRTHKVSYENYWKYMAEQQTCMIGVYIPHRHTFAYCHWWNSVTGKMYGSHRGRIGRDEAMTLLANFSFNDRPIYLVEVGKDNISTTVKTYTRSVGCQAITLVAGGHKGLYPYKYNKNVLEFADVGLVSHENITIGWPRRRIRKGAAPIAKIVEEVAQAEYMRFHQSALQTSPYKAAYSVLDVGEEYTISDLTFYQYRGKDAIFAITTCGIYIRCGKSLQGLVEKWMEKYPKDKTPCLSFKATMKKATKGIWDMVVV